MNDTLKNRRKELIARVKLAARARGVVFVPFNTADCKAVVGKNTPASLNAMVAAEPAGPKRTVAEFRRAVKLQLLSLYALHGFGGQVSANYKRKMLLLVNTPAGAPPKDWLYRSDFQLVLAFQLKDGPGGIGGMNPSNELVALAGYGALDFDAEIPDNALAAAPCPAADRPGVDNALDEAEHDGNALALDLVATHQATRSTGTLLTAFVLAKEFARTKRGGPRFESCFSSLIWSGAAGAVPRVYPFGGVARVLGFVDTGIDDANNNGEIFALVPAPGSTDVVQRLLANFAAAFPPTKLKDICPFKTKTGLRQCQ